MNHIRLLLAFVALASIGAVASSPLAGIAQDATPDGGQHVLVGAWIVDPETSDPANPPSFDIFMADGTLVNIGSDGASIGAWEATGPTTAKFTFTGLLGDQGSEGMFVIRGDVELAADGQSFTGTHAFSILTPDGTVAASFLGAGAAGTRMVAEDSTQGEGPLPGFQPWSPAAQESTPAA